MRDKTQYPVISLDYPFKKIIYLFALFLVALGLVAAHRLSLVVVSKGYFGCVPEGFLIVVALLVVEPWALAFRICSTQAQ